MYDCRKFFINGEFIDASDRPVMDIVNPATESPVGQVSLGTKEDVDRAVTAARRAFESFSRTSRDERVALLNSIVAEYGKRIADLGEAISNEMGAPQPFATQVQAGAGLGHFALMVETLKNSPEHEVRGTTMLRYEPVGVCGLISPWNWPANQICCKVAPALAAGCTMVLKPSEMSPISAQIIAEILAAAGVPKGVFNLVQGDGPTVGQRLAEHPQVDMISFTGSTRAGMLVSAAAAKTVKRVSLELGGKSANIILDDADLPTAVTTGVLTMVNNSGQSCNAPSRMLVAESQYEEAIKIAAAAMAQVVVGPPKGEGTQIGPLANGAQFKKVQHLIEAGAKEGARVVVGGAGRPDGLDKGYYVRPTLFADVNNDMTIAQEEIFGPVLVMIPYRDEEEAIGIANESEYGLSGYVWSGNRDHAVRVASQIRTGMVHINGAPVDFNAPFGGYKKSGNGREWGAEGLKEFQEVKAMMGAAG